MQTSESEWKRLHEGLLDLLSESGENDFLGQKDYWVVDDDWGENQQKVCVHNPHILNPKLVGKVQEFLRHTAPNWQVVIALELPHCETQAIVVEATRMHEHWDLDALRTRLNMPQFFH